LTKTSRIPQALQGAERVGTVIDLARLWLHDGTPDPRRHLQGGVQPSGLGSFHLLPPEEVPGGHHGLAASVPSKETNLRRDGRKRRTCV